MKRFLLTVTYTFCISSSYLIAQELPVDESRLVQTTESKWKNYVSVGVSGFINQSAMFEAGRILDLKDMSLLLSLETLQSKYLHEFGGNAYFRSHISLAPQLSVFYGPGINFGYLTSNWDKRTYGRVRVCAGATYNNSSKFTQQCELRLSLLQIAYSAFESEFLFYLRPSHYLEINYGVIF